MSNEKGKAAPEAAPEAQNSSAGPSPELVAQVQARLAALNAAGSGAGASTSGSASGGSHLLSLDRKTKLQRKQKYAFWETQPVVQFDAKEEEQVRPEQRAGRHTTRRRLAWHLHRRLF